jgi:hypothetical protein
MGGQGEEVAELSSYQSGVLTLAETGVAALVLGLTILVFLLAVHTVRHI